MRIDNRQLRDFISDSAMVPAGDLEASFQEAEGQKKSLGNILLEKKLIENLKKIRSILKLSKTKS